MANNSNEKLLEANQRFINKTTNPKNVVPGDLAKGQSPHTIVITCADSRVPPELIFDAELGELFVIRVAGNTATDEVIGSAEYAAANLDQAESSLWGIALAELFLQRLMLNSLETLFQAHHWRQLSPQLETVLR